MSKRNATGRSPSDKPKQQQAPRIERSLLEKLEALDDHMFLLRDALHHLQYDDARLKTLASELRLLICMSSGTEGLLWRLTRELEVNELVYVHASFGEVDLNDPINEGLQLAQMSLHRGGNGPPNKPAENLNFREIIKESPAMLACRGNHHGLRSR